MKNITKTKFWLYLYKKPMNYLLSFSNDKILHFIVSMILVQILYLLINHISIALIITLIIGLFKEIVIDKYLMHTEIDTKDIKMDINGMLGGFIMSFLIHILH